MRIIGLLTLAAALGFSGSAAAQPGGSDGGLVGLGVGVITSTQPYAGIEDEVRTNIIPALAYDRGRFWFAGKQAGIILTDPDSDGPLELSAIVDYRFQGYEADESPVFAGMDDRDSTLEAGANVTFDLGGARLVGQVLTDVLDTHGGFEAFGQAEMNFQLAKYTLVRPFAGIQLRSNQLNDYYYGIEDDEASTTAITVDGASVLRGAYAPGSTVNPYVGVFARQALNKHLVVTVFARHEKLPTEIADSPIVEKEHQTSLGVIFAKPFF